MPKDPARLESLPPVERLLAVMERLRDPKDGCPWDLEQDHDSLKPYLIEEAYETLSAIDKGVDAKLCEELGDLLLQIVFHAELARQRRAFDFHDVAAAISAKLIKRHPHIFGDVQADTAETVIKNWEEIKLEGEGERSILAGIPEGLPSLLKAYRTQEKIASVGFDWPSDEANEAKIREEIGEFKEALAAGDRKALEKEYGDLLFALVSYGRRLGINAEFCLQHANAGFRRRFERLEALARDDGRPLSEYAPNELAAAWDRVKADGHDPETGAENGA